MPDWNRIVSEKMTALNLPSGAREEVIAELAVHMEETYEHAHSRGLSETAALEATLQEVGLQEINDWHVLAADVSRAKSKEGPMNARTKSLWLPALASLFASSLFLFVLTELSMRAPLLVRLNSGAAQWLYAVWIVGQIAFGALGAFLSRRVGGSRMARVVAGTFPAIVMLASCVIVIPVSALMQHNDFIFHNPGRLWWGAFLWAVAPAVTLLLGAAPFLQEPSKRHA
jgi:VIT1/CCC1 family predicted Fe2+/Mn2+ transporter